MPARTPQDRRPKKKTTTKAKLTKYEFTIDGETYTLPLATKGAEKLSGRVMRDAFMDDDGEMKLGFALLEACGAAQAVVDMIYDLPAPECLKVIAGWMRFGDGDGASLPQS